jgi:alpha-N-arabinofuranosidase
MSPVGLSVECKRMSLVSYTTRGFGVSCIFLAAALALLCPTIASAQSSESSATVTTHLDRPIGPIDPNIFGHFTEETLTSYEGGVSSEMIFNRKFEIPEERDVHRPWMTGCPSGWDPISLDGRVTLLVDRSVYYSASQSERISNEGTGIAGIQQRGYRIVMRHVSPNQRVDDPFRFRTGERYKVRIAVKNRDLHGSLFVAIGESQRNALALQEIRFSGGEDWKVYQLELDPKGETRDGRFMIYTDSPGTVWVDSVSMVREDLDDGGLRKDVIDATRRLMPGDIRWPGGWFVSDYHWKDGIGPVDKRPALLSRVWNAYTNNDVGVDEYMALCKKVGAEPYIVVNVGTGSPEEAAELVEYVNGGPKTRWGRIRVQNGHPEPYNVKLWNIGNEEYLPNLGATSGAGYARNFLAFSKAMRAVDPSIKLIAVGMFEIPEGAIPADNPMHVVVRYAFDWGKQFFPVAIKDADYYAIHYYEPGDSIKNQVSADDLDRSSMVIAEDLYRRLQPIFQLMEHEGRRIPIALDEWSLKMPDNLPATDISDRAKGLKSPEQLGMLGPMVNLRQAVGEAGVYNMMQRHPQEFGLSSLTILYAYLIGTVGISRDQAVVSPVGLMLELFATHDRCTALQTAIESPTFDVSPVEGFAGTKAANYIDVTSRLHPDGKTVDVFVVNRSLRQDLNVSLQFAGNKVRGPAAITTLASDKITDMNTFEQPDHVKLESSVLEVDPVGKVTRRFPPHSVTRVTLQMQ